MNRATLGMLALSICVSTAGGMVGTMLMLGTAQPVQAAPERKELRIAIVNLEDVARSSQLFAQHKTEWDTIRKEVSSWIKKMERDYDSTLTAIKRGRLSNPDDSLIDLRVRLQA